jgi:hypothetical protein
MEPDQTTVGLLEGADVSVVSARDALANLAAVCTVRAA